MGQRGESRPVRLRRRRKANGEGFTLLEMMIALLILGIVLGAVAPAFYGVLRAGTITNYKSVANGIAVQSTEQMRSYAYFEVGYYTSPDGCPHTDSNPAVLLSSTIPAPLTTLPTTQTVGHVTYDILRCVNWVNASDGSSLAYKQTYVKVSWSVDGAASSVAQTSALYPGGNGVYTTGGENDWAPAATTTTLGTTPDAPASVTAADDTGSPGYLVDVSWAAVSGASCYNIWFGPTNPGTNAESTMSDAQADMDVCGTSTSIDVIPSTNYYIQVVAVGTAGTSNPTSAAPWPVNSGAATTTTTTSGSTTTTTTAAGSTTTTAAPTTTTAPAPCAATGITVNPAGQNSRYNQAYLNSSNDTLAANNGSFSVTLTLSGSGCSPQVAYNPTGCVPGATNCGASYLSTYTVSGNQYTFTTDPSIAWTSKVTDQFIPVVGGVASTTYSAQSYVCVENGSSGNCK